jgi:hypothetical protein
MLADTLAAGNITRRGTIRNSLIEELVDLRRERKMDAKIPAIQVNLYLSYP